MRLGVFLMVSSLLACGSFPKRPDGFIYSLDTPLSLSYEFKAPKTIKAPIEPTGKEKPINQMDKYFCISPKYYIKLREWGEDLSDYAEKKCNK